MANTNILTTLPTNKENKRRNLLYIIAIAIIVGIFVALLIASSVKAQNNDTDSKQIAEYEYQINELRKSKEQCYNDLSYEDSIKTRDGFIKPCVQWDEQIMAIREKADALKAKSYEGLN